MSSKQFVPGSRSNIFHVDPLLPLVIGIDTQHKEGEHPLFDDSTDFDDDFVENVKKFGVMSPVHCRKSGTDIEVVYGRKRTLALRKANEQLVKEGKEPHKLPITAEPHGTSDMDLFEKVVVENVGRFEASPMKKADYLKRWFDMKAKAGEEVNDVDASVVFKTTPTSIRNWKKLWDLDPKVQKAVLQGQISANEASSIADLSPADQVKHLSQVQDANKAPTKDKKKGKQLEQARKARTGSFAATAYVAPSMSTVRKIAENLEMTSTLPPVVVSVIKFLTGLTDGSDLPELKTLVEKVPARGKKLEEKSGPTLSSAQKTALETIDSAKDGVVLYSSLKSKSVEALLKLGMVDRFEGEDGLLYVKRGTGVAAPVPAAASKPAKEPKAPKAPKAAAAAKGAKPAAKKDPSKTKIPSLEKLENMPIKELSALASSLGLGPYEKGKAGATKMVTDIVSLKKSREKAAEGATAQA